MTNRFEPRFFDMLKNQSKIEDITDISYRALKGNKSYDRKVNLRASLKP